MSNVKESMLTVWRFHSAELHEELKCSNSKKIFLNLKSLTPEKNLRQEQFEQSALGERIYRGVW